MPLIIILYINFQSISLKFNLFILFLWPLASFIKYITEDKFLFFSRCLFFNRCLFWGYSFFFWPCFKIMSTIILNPIYVEVIVIIITIETRVSLLWSCNVRISKWRWTNSKGILIFSRSILHLNDIIMRTTKERWIIVCSYWAISNKRKSKCFAWKKLFRIKMTKLFFGWRISHTKCLVWFWFWIFNFIYFNQ